MNQEVVFFQNIITSLKETGDTLTSLLAKRFKEINMDQQEVIYSRRRYRNMKKKLSRANTNLMLSINELEDAIEDE